MKIEIPEVFKVKDSSNTNECNRISDLIQKDPNFKKKANIVEKVGKGLKGYFNYDKSIESNFYKEKINSFLPEIQRGERLMTYSELSTIMAYGKVSGEGYMHILESIKPEFRLTQEDLFRWYKNEYKEWLMKFNKNGRRRLFSRVKAIIESFKKV